MTAFNQNYTLLAIVADGVEALHGQVLSPGCLLQEEALEVPAIRTVSCHLPATHCMRSRPEALRTCIPGVKAQSSLHAERQRRYQGAQHSLSMQAAEPQGSQEHLQLSILAMALQASSAGESDIRHYGRKHYTKSLGIILGAEQMVRPSRHCAIPQQHIQHQILPITERVSTPV